MVLAITVVAFHFDWSSVGVSISLISNVLAAVLFIYEIRAVIRFVICILFFISVGVYLIYFLSCYFRNCVISWFMVGLCVCISLGDLVDAFVEIPIMIQDS